MREKTIYELAAEMGVHPETLRWRMSQIGIKPKRRIGTTAVFDPKTVFSEIAVVDGRTYLVRELREALAAAEERLAKLEE